MRQDVAELLRLLDDELPDALGLRRRLHAAPELAHRERHTSASIVEALGGDVTVVHGTAVLARAGGHDHPVLARAELDGLPLAEATDAPFAATNGAMHACGHDVHMAALVALCRALRRHPDPPAPLLAVFQPSEEDYPSGAELLVREGYLPECRAAVAAHVHPALPEGEVSSAAGPVNASCDYFTIVVRGSGGHAAYPHETRDPVLALSAVVVAAQQLVSRRSDPTHAAVVAFTRLAAGHAENVTPDAAEARGTLRAFVPDDRESLRAHVKDVAHHVARAHACEAEVEIRPGEPTLVNDPVLAGRLAELLPEAGLSPGAPLRSCGSDDFGFYGEIAPTLMAFVGMSQKGSGAPLHDPGFLPTEAAVGAVARTLALAYCAGA